LLMPDMFNGFRLNEAGKSGQDRASVNLDDIFPIWEFAAALALSSPSPFASA
jgi:hypothetical protein